MGIIIWNSILLSQSLSLSFSIPLRIGQQFALLVTSLGTTPEGKNRGQTLAKINRRKEHSFPPAGWIRLSSKNRGSRIIREQSASVTTEREGEREGEKSEGRKKRGEERRKRGGREENETFNRGTLDGRWIHNYPYRKSIVRGHVAEGVDGARAGHEGARNEGVKRRRWRKRRRDREKQGARRGIFGQQSASLCWKIWNRLEGSRPVPGRLRDVDIDADAGVGPSGR